MKSLECSVNVYLGLWSYGEYHIIHFSFQQFYFSSYMESNGRGTELKPKDDADETKVLADFEIFVLVSKYYLNLSECEGHHEKYRQYS